MEKFKLSNYMRKKNKALRISVIQSLQIKLKPKPNS